MECQAETLLGKNNPGRAGLGDTGHPTGPDLILSRGLCSVQQPFIAHTETTHTLAVVVLLPSLSQ